MNEMIIYRRKDNLRFIFLDSKTMCKTKANEKGKRLLFSTGE